MRRRQVSGFVLPVVGAIPNAPDDLRLWPLVVVLGSVLLGAVMPERGQAAPASAAPA